MATVESIARAALGDLAVAEGKLLNAKRWVNDRYADLAATIRLRQLRRLGELTVPAVGGCRRPGLRAACPFSFSSNC